MLTLGKSGLKFHGNISFFFFKKRPKNKKKSPRSDIDHTETDSRLIIGKLKIVYSFKDQLIRNKE